MIGDIFIPLIWAGGLLSLASIVAQKRSIEPELFFPAAGFLGLIIYALGLINCLYPSIFWGMTLILGISLIRGLYLGDTLVSLFEAVKKHPVVTLVIIVVSAPLVLAALSYPVTIDSLNVHLGLPKQYAHAGKIFFTEDNLFSASPRTLEMIITGFYSMGFERAGQFFVLLIAAIFLWAVWRRASSFGGYGGIAILLILSVPIFLGQAICSKNDFLLWGLCFFAISKLWDFARFENNSDIIWAGIGAGMAAGTKAIGLAIYGPLAIILLYNLALGYYRLRAFLYFTIFFLLLASPWYVYSWVITGNPVYPFFNSIFHSSYFPASYEAFNNQIAVKSVAKSHFLISPFELVFQPNSYDGRLGYALLLFPALLIFIRKIPMGIKTLIGISLLFYPIWFFGFTYARFLLPISAALAIAGSFAFMVIADENRILRAMVYFSLGIALLLPLPGLYRDMAPRAKAVLKGESKYEFLSEFEIMNAFRTESAATYKAFPYINAWRYLKENSPETCKVGILSSFNTRADGYYLDRDFIYLNPSEQLAYNFSILRDYDQINKVIARLRLNFVVIDSAVVSEFSNSSEWSHYPNFQILSDGVASLISYLETNSTPVYSDSRFIVFKI